MHESTKNPTWTSTKNMNQPWTHNESSTETGTDHEYQQKLSLNN